MSAKEIQRMFERVFNKGLDEKLKLLYESIDEIKANAGRLAALWKGTSAGSKLNERDKHLMIKSEP